LSLAAMLCNSAAAQGLTVPIIVDSAIPQSLTVVPGDPVEGERIARDMTNASCLICHALPIADEPDPGNIAPPLDGVADRYSEGELRLRLVDPKAINPGTVMPAYYKTEGLNRVLEPYAGKPIYTAQQVEDVVAYLMTLREAP
jgi:sulfur-oxidizing protein SoxX